MKYYLFDSLTCLATAVFVILHCHGISANDKSDRTIVNVDVYYESLCGDSMRFITSQLVPSYPDLKQHLHVTFIPYGKATHTRESANDLWHFECQHGPMECYGNKAQACGIHAIQTSEEAQNREELTVRLVGCAMKARNTIISVTSCAQSIGLSEKTRALISECTNSTLGDDLLAVNGDKTDAIQAPLKFVPTIVINRVYSKENQDEALRNFPALICRHLAENEKPSLCSSVGEGSK